MDKPRTSGIFHRHSLQEYAMASPTPQMFPLASILTHDRLQVRVGTDFATVKRYAERMRRGVPFAPLRLAEVGGKLYVIDGHHRLEAAHAAGLVAISAQKTRMSLTDAMKEALKSNQDHGRLLTRKDKEKALRAYVDAGLHLWDDSALDRVAGTVKPRRLIAAECPVYSFQHIGKKLKEWGIDAPSEDVKPFDRSSRYEDEGEWGSDPEHSTDDIEQRSLLSTFKDRLDSAMSSLALMDVQRREAALEMIRGHLKALGADPLPRSDWQPLEI